MEAPDVEKLLDFAAVVRRPAQDIDRSFWSCRVKV